MDDFLENNKKLLFDELESRCFPLSEDAHKFLEFTLNPTDEFKCIDGVYYYPFQGKEIPFRLLSDVGVSEYDEKILKSEERNEYESLRSLRIAASHLLPESTYMAVLADYVKSLVKYKKDGEEYIIDYAKNLLMKSDDYKLFFPYKVIEEIDQYNLSYCSELIKELWHIMPINLILISFSEIMEYMRKIIPTFAPYKYSSGIHWRNRYLFSLKDELLFSITEEYQKMSDDEKVIFNFTLNPLARRYAISVTDDNYFIYKDYRFRRISDCINVDKFMKELVTYDRSNECMAGSIWMSLILANTYEPYDIRIVLGSIPRNDYEGFSHAWVEFKDKKTGKWIAVDYTYNLEMESDDFIILRDAKVIKTIRYPVIKKLCDFYRGSGLETGIFPILYFGEEMSKNLEKNKSLFKGMH